MKKMLLDLIPVFLLIAFLRFMKAQFPNSFWLWTIIYFLIGGTLIYFVVKEAKINKYRLI